MACRQKTALLKTVTKSGRTARGIFLNWCRLLKLRQRWRRRRRRCWRQGDSSIYRGSLWGDHQRDVKTRYTAASEILTIPQRAIKVTRRNRSLEAVLQTERIQKTFYASVIVLMEIQRTQIIIIYKTVEGLQLREGELMRTSCACTFYEKMVFWCP